MAEHTDEGNAVCDYFLDRERISYEAPRQAPALSGVDIESIDMLWKRGDGTELSISFTPEGRDGAGTLRYNRGTSISYIDRSRVCPTH